MAADTELAFTPAYQLRKLIGEKRLSPVELTEACIRRIESLNPRLNAFLTIAADHALADAREAEHAVVRGDPLGPLHGIPISLKDLEPAKGIRCTRGSLVFRDWIADRDEIAVERLKKAGAIVVGKTNTPEFGRLGTTENRLGDDCRNPWNPAATSGGSSGGAAASVAAGMVPIAQGSDGGGSIRIPSSFCGVFGIKATQGRVPRRSQGVASWHPVNFSCVGPMTRNVRDAAIMLRVLAGPADDAENTTLRDVPPDYESIVFGDARASEDGPGTSMKGVRVAWCPEFGGAAVDPEIRQQVESSVQAFERMGATVEPVGVDLEIDWLWQTYYTITAVKTAFAFGALFEQRGDLLTDYVKGDVAWGRRTAIDRYHRALCELEQYRGSIAELFQRFDLLMSPTTAVAAFPCRKNPGLIGGKHVAARWGFYPFTFPFNMAGNPAANVPCGFTREGLPVGLQIVGRKGDEVSVLRASAAFETERPWAGRKPELSP
ncbi:MAG: amidase [Chloroflexi bacterium]|nr:amidase [Chloroflexota bacterium]